MPNKADNLEIVHEGWLTKSPPSKRIWRARWRRRWFVLRHSGELPGQYYLCYYTDKNCRTLKGQIDLDQCEQVDAGLQFESSKHKYRHMFDVKTPKRIYYLAAETEDDMNKWVDCVCHVCGLKAYSQEDTLYPYIEDGTSLTGDSSQADSPPVSPSSTASGPYIPISECTSGHRANTILPPVQPSSGTNDEDDSYDQPRKLELASSIEWRAANAETPPPLHSPPATNTDHDSVFTDDDDLRPTVNWTTFPLPSDSSLDDMKVVSNGGRRRYTKPVAPPRPPKPGHLVLQDSTDSLTYSNLESPIEALSRQSELAHNDMYDCPRSHQLNTGQENIDPVPLPRARQQYTNALPTGSGVIFRYDFPPDYSIDEPSSPRSEPWTANAGECSNTSSPAGSLPPPAVDRGLKPGRKTSDSVSNESSPLQPNIDLDRLRILKPSATSQTRVKDESSIPLKLSAPPARRSDYSTHTVRYCSSNTSPTQRSVQSESEDHELTSPEHENSRFATFSHYSTRSSGSSKQIEIQYLDLDLDQNENTGSPVSTTAEATATVYKEVDFVKTEAFNKTRQKVEEDRKQCSDVT
uniref:Putative pleckstrin similarity domain protein n=1 Tax=Panstrongylus megistus TaxID=65343 RepID=A0A069DVK0_9HEMI